MNKHYTEIISQISICICSVSAVVCAAFLNIQPLWLNIVVSIIISLIASYGVVYFLIGRIFRLVYKLKAREFNLAGTWYIVYYSNYVEDHYLRIGKLIILQDFEQIRLDKLTSHSPEIQNNSIVHNKYRDYEDSEKPSTGNGFGEINIHNRTFAGIYYITRSSQQTAVGMFHCKILDKEMEGEFTTTEPSRINNKPVGGKLMFFRDEKAQLDFCNNLINAAKEKIES